MHDDSSLWLLADIGATHARFALYDPQHQTYSQESQTLVTQHESLLAACQWYLEPRVPSISAVALAIACPVLGDQVTMTNHRWHFSQQQLKNALCLNHLVVINDQVAIAHSIPFLSEHSLQSLGPRLTADVASPKGVLAPGSGLGTATLVPTENGGHAFASEGGHVTLAATNEFETQVIAALAKRYGHISAERLISGQGITNLYDTICNLEGAPCASLTPTAIVAAVQNDPHAQKTLTYFARFLGNVAGNLALSLGARGGIYLGGGILPKLGDSFDAATFRTAFEAKGRFVTYLKTIPTFLITHPLPAFIGLQRVIRSILRIKVE